MKLKKSISLVCASALTLSMGVTAFAVDPTPTVTTAGEASEFSYTTAMFTAPIKITMATSADLYVNPYGASVEVGTKADGTKAKAKFGIISPTQYIKNSGETDIKVGVQITPKFSKSITQVAVDGAPDFKTISEKKATLKLEMITVANDTSDPTNALSPTDKGKWATTAKTVDTGAANGKEFQMVGGTGNSAFKIPKATTTGTPAVTTPGCAAFRMVGDITEEPKKEDGTPDKWTDSDTVEATIAFTFIPA